MKKTPMKSHLNNSRYWIVNISRIYKTLLLQFEYEKMFKKNSKYNKNIYIFLVLWNEWTWIENNLFQ